MESLHEKVTAALEAALAMANKQLKATAHGAASHVVSKINAALKWQAEVPAAPPPAAKPKAPANKETKK